jgi:hypothetical protein
MIDNLTDGNGVITAVGVGVAVEAPARFTAATITNFKRLYSALQNVQVANATCSDPFSPSLTYCPQ